MPLIRNSIQVNCKDAKNDANVRNGPKTLYILGQMP